MFVHSFKLYFLISSGNIKLNSALQTNCFSTNPDPSQIAEKDNWLEGKTEELTKALQSLDHRSKEILTQRWLTDKKVTLKKLAKQYKVSIERIRQIEDNAIKELRAKLKEA